MTETQFKLPNGQAVGWRDYVDTRLNSLEKATEVAHRAMQDRLAGMNEFRNTLQDQAARFITRNEMEAQLNRIDSEVCGRLDRLDNDVKLLRENIIPRKEIETMIDRLEEDIKILELAKATLEGKASVGSVYIAYIGTFIGIVLGIISLVEMLSK